MPISISGGGNYASLDESGKVPASQLPSYVDDVVEFANLAAFPATGEVGKIYVAVNSAKAYRWSGSVYIEVSPSLVESVAGRTGTVVLSKSDVGLGNVDNTADASKPVSTAQAAADASVQAYAIQRANHTGTQTASTISDFSTAAAAAAPVQSVNGQTGSVTIATYSLPDATTTTKGGVIVGTGLGVSSGAVSVTYGTTSGTACQGNDSRLSDTRTPTDGSVTDAKIDPAGLSTSSLNWAAIAEWQPSTAYAKGALVSYLGVAYRRSAAGTSGSTFNTSNWQQITPSVNVVSTPTSLSADQNDYTLPATADIIRLSSSAARNITGIAAGASGQAELLINVGSFAITLKHQSTSSAAANRFIVPWAGDYVMDANGGAALIVYDATDSRWRVV